MKPRKRTESAIPVGTQFSPDLLDLPALLQVIVARSGDRDAMVNGFWSKGVRIAPVKKAPTKRRRHLPLEAAVQYGLLTQGDFSATPLATKLAGLAPPALYDAFARHVLLNLGGLRVVEAVEQMTMDRLHVTGDSLASYLTSQGFVVTIHNTAINSLRKWLAKAGLFPEGRPSRAWEISATEKRRLLGLSEEAVGALVGLTDEQRAFAVALCRIAPVGWYAASDVRALAEATSGLRLGRESLPAQFLEPLREAGLIDYKSGGTAAGKSARLRTTAQFSADVLEAFVSTTVRTLDPTTASYFKKRPADIYSELESSDRFKKGQALEAYAIHLMRLLGLRFLEWRLRAGSSTGWAEVDAVFAGVIGAVPTRWQVQCKHTPRTAVDLDVVAREVGLLPVTQATHILLVATGPVTKDAREFAAQVMQRSPVTILLLDGQDFSTVKKSPGLLGHLLRTRADEILRQRPSGSLFAWKKQPLK